MKRLGADRAFPAKYSKEDESAGRTFDEKVLDKRVEFQLFCSCRAIPWRFSKTARTTG